MRLAVAFVALVLVVPLARAAEREQLPPPRVVGDSRKVLPAPQALPAPVQVLPAPMPLVELGPMGTALPGYWRPSQYARWQEYSVDLQGFWRPRVILAPQPYYLYNGMPYPWLTTRPLDLIPGRAN